MRHNGHIRQRSNGSFEIRYSLGANPLTGKWKVKTVTLKGTRKDAEIELRRILRTADTGEYIEPTKVTVRDFLKQWLETIRAQVSLKTHEGYAEVVDHFLIPAFGGVAINKLSPTAVQHTYNNWERTGRRDGKEGGLAPRTRLFIHRVLKSALKHAVQLQVITRNPADAVKAPRIKKSATTTLTVEQSTVLLDALHGNWLYWPVLLAVTTGMRRGEILALRWKNIDLDNKTVRVVESLEQTKQGIRFKAPKTERTRAIVMPDYTLEQLRELKAKQAEEFAQLNILQTENSLVCTLSDDKPILPLTVTHQFARVIKRTSSIPKVRFHDLRHSHATQLLNSGIHPKIAQERLGHSTITTTLDLYSHASDTMQNEAATRLNEALRSALKKRFNATLEP